MPWYPSTQLAIGCDDFFGWQCFLILLLLSDPLLFLVIHYWRELFEVDFGGWGSRFLSDRSSPPCSPCCSPSCSPLFLYLILTSSTLIGLLPFVGCCQAVSAYPVDLFPSPSAVRIPVYTVVDRSGLSPFSDYRCSPSGQK